MGALYLFNELITVGASLDLMARGQALSRPLLRR
jgi:hypothetical protein